jgi:thioredoxin 1
MGSNMNAISKVVIVVVLVAAVGVVFAMKAKGKPTQPPVIPAKAPQAAESVSQAGAEAVPAKDLPRLVDLGANKCIPCKAMKPILDELRTTYAGRFDVVFIDVWENPARAKEFGIEIIPTQIFFDASGKELFRHQGFYGKDEILAKWKELGVDTAAPAVK